MPQPAPRSRASSPARPGHVAGRRGGQGRWRAPAGSTPHQPTIASPNRSQPGFVDAAHARTLPHTVATARLARCAPLLPSEQADGERPDHDRDDRHAEQRRQLRCGPQPRILEPLDAGRREVADPDAGPRGAGRPAAGRPRPGTSRRRTSGWRSPSRSGTLGAIAATRSPIANSDVMPRRNAARYASGILPAMGSRTRHSPTTTSRHQGDDRGHQVDDELRQQQPSG